MADWPPAPAPPLPALLGKMRLITWQPCIIALKLNPYQVTVMHKDSKQPAALAASGDCILFHGEWKCHSKVFPVLRNTSNTFYINFYDSASEFARAGWFIFYEVHSLLLSLNSSVFSYLAALGVVAEMEIPRLCVTLLSHTHTHTRLHFYISVI